MKCYIFLVIFSPIYLFALPQGLEVQSGTASHQAEGHQLHIQNSENAILQWREFSIAKGEKVHFQQNHGKSAVLNRVSGTQCSDLLGHLTSNGKVFLINPNGVLIGADAHIQTGGFLASTADLSNDDFLKGKELLFTSPGDGEIINKGQISCPKGDIFLIAKTVRNEKDLSAQHVALLSAEEVLIRPEGEERFLIRLGIDDGHIENSGTIEALTTDLRTTSAYEKAICQTGYIYATTTYEENGRIYLIAENGEAFVDGELLAESGEVHVLGKEVVLDTHASIDVSGPNGGTVLIGGDFQGSNPDVLNAQTTTAKEGSFVRADSTEDGDGGTIIYWSDGITRVAGKSSVRGGPDGGNGGFVEVSGKESFLFSGWSDRRAPLGKCGELLLDPEQDITISGAAETAFTIVGSPPNVTLLPTTQPAVLNNIPADTLLTQLALGDVTINTFNAAGPGGGSGNLTFSAPFTWSANSLTCNVGREALFSANVTNTGTGDFTVIAQRDIRFPVPNVIVSSTSATTGGNITLRALGIPSNEDYSGISIARDCGVQTDAGTITLEGLGGTVGIDYGVIINFTSNLQTNSGDIHVTGSSRGTSLSDGIHIGNTSNITSTSGSIFLTGNVLDSGTHQGVQILQGSQVISGTGGIQIRGTTIDFQGVAIINAGTLIQTNSGDIDIYGAGGDEGIFMSGTPSITSNGNIRLTGTSLNNSRGITVSDTTIT